MIRIANLRKLLHCFVILACILSTQACKTASTKPFVEQTKPEVRCKQPQDPKLPPAPRADEWVEYKPETINGPAYARLSEPAVLWVRAAAKIVQQLRGIREQEHDCLDEHEAQGLIQQ